MFVSDGLVLEGLTKAYGNTRAVHDVSLAIPAGRFVGVIGRSGAGKSTLLRMINRLGEPTQGRVLWQGTEVTGTSGRKLRDWRRRCAMIFQQFNLVGRLDVLNNVLLGRLAYTPFWRAALKAWPLEDRSLALAALDQLDIATLAPRRADNLSGGQQQRVAICRALVQEPEIVLADEPVASLDPRNAKIVMDALQRINRHFGLTVLCNLHSLDLARTYCDRLVGMAAGRVVFDDVPAALTDDVTRELYGMEANEVMGTETTAIADADVASVPMHA
jgi:phosphonate transport system ATP-binding protein